MHRNASIRLLIICLTAFTANAEVTVTATFNPPRVMRGDKARYIIEIKESSDSTRPSIQEVDSLPIPGVDGLELSNGRTSVGGQQFTIINGVTKYSVSQKLMIDAKASKTGRYTIPAYVFQYGDDSLRVPAATLEVTERTASAPPPTDELIFLQVDKPEQLYVGQTAEILLKMYISEQVRFRSLVSFDRNADSFTISELPDPRESVEIYKGRNYRLLSWPLTVTPIQSGDQKLSFQFTVAAQMPGQNPSLDPFGRRGFGTSIFDDFFGRTERFTLYTDPTQIEVLPLPNTNQPDSFSGAIGSFAMNVSTDRETTDQGEPIMLSIEISGEGNFDRLNGPSISDSPNWRSYKPESIFTPSTENSRIRGRKRFDYVMIPNATGELTLPKAAFAYFDPGTEEYVELMAPKITIAVSPSSSASASVATQELLSPQETEIIAQPVQKELSVEEAFLSLDYQTDRRGPSSTPITQNTWFWAGNTLVGSLLAAAYWIIRRNRRLREDSVYAEQHALKQELGQARKQALASENPGVFYESGQLCIRLAASYRSGKNLRTATAAQIHHSGIGKEVAEDINALFKAADAHRFSQSENKGDLRSAKRDLERILKAI
jgi:hypothetical protein